MGKSEKMCVLDKCNVRRHIKQKLEASDLPGSSDSPSGKFVFVEVMGNPNVVWVDSAIPFKKLSNKWDTLSEDKQPAKE